MRTKRGSFVLSLALLGLVLGGIMTQFLNSPPPAKTLAVTGGTGNYRNARGQGELVESGHGTATLSFDLIG